MLAFYYQPTAAEAYRSVTSIVRDVSFGNLLNQVHRWSALLFLVILATRVLRFFFAGLYGRGRELIWMVAVVSFAAAVLGGLGSGAGAVLGGLVLGIAETLSAGYISSAYKDVIAFVLMLAVLFFMPRGLLGGRITERV